MKFVCLLRGQLELHKSPETCRLIWNTWDDFGFKTTFYVSVIDALGVEWDLGSVRIMQKGQESGVPEIPEVFDALDNSFCSLGGDRSYYTTLAEMAIADRQAVLKGLNDCVADQERFLSFRDEKAMRSSLLREASPLDVQVNYQRILNGDSALTPFQFTYLLDEYPDSAGLRFRVTPQSKPPTNIHVLIGRNGVGKTRLLAGMADALTENRAASIGMPGRFSFGTTRGVRTDFLNLVIVSYSAFDRFDPVAAGQERTEGSVPYYYVGIKKTAVGKGGAPVVALKTPDELDVEFSTALRAIVDAPIRLERWVEAVKTLGSDPRIRDLAPESLLDDSSRLTALVDIETAFSIMSSGHKIVLLTITKLVENVSDRSLVLLDEPETHLHPPLLGSFIRALSRLLVSRNAVAVIATHSPVVLQEVPKRCVWFLGRSGSGLGEEAAPVETFAENVSVLTRKVFGLEVEDSGFYRLLREESATPYASYESVVEAFGDEIGAEGRALTRAFTWKAD